MLNNGISHLLNNAFMKPSFGQLGYLAAVYFNTEVGKTVILGPVEINLSLVENSF